MKAICPNCEKETEIALIRGKETVRVRGEPVEVDSEYSKCAECGEEFENTRGYDSLEAAYREYRRQHNLLQPEDIQGWRKRYGVTQKELSQLLGWGDATLSRYENGALQSEANEKMLRLVMEPHNLLKLIEESPGALPTDKHRRLVKELGAAEAEACSFERVMEERFANYEPDEFSGYRRFDLQRLFNAILFLCRGGQLKTKLNKLLFYADFKHFKEYTISLTGVHYVHLQLGPVPINYEFFFAELINEGFLEVDEILVGPYWGENYLTKREPDLTIFSDSEIKVLADVKDYFRSFTSSQIKDFSHKERGYLETMAGQPITYRFAQDLQI